MDRLLVLLGHGNPLIRSETALLLGNAVSVSSDEIAGILSST